MVDSGRSPKGSGSRPSGRAAKGVSPVPASIPSAAEKRIMNAVERALATLNDPTMNWQEYYRRLKRAPELVLHNIREAQVLFRLPEQADWPLLIEAFEPRPYTLTIRTQMTIGGQTFGYDQQQDDILLYSRPPVDRDLAVYMGRQAIRATLEAVAQPFYEQAALQFASAIEARRTEKQGGSVHESATSEAGDAHPSSPGVSHV
jgi:hypothetical protein